MNTSHVTTLRRALTFVAMVSVMLFPASSALAEGAISFTETYHNVTTSFPDVNPCTGDPGTLTITYNGVLHFTQLPNGTSHFTVTQTGDAVFVPDDPSLPTYTGHFTIWAGVNPNNNNTAGTVTSNVHLTGSDGSTLDFHLTEHFNVSASGVVNTFSKPSCG